MTNSNRIMAAAIMTAWLAVATGCTSTAPTAFAGRSQAAAFQRALRDCLGREGVRYKPVITEPGSVLSVVPAPVPDEWWASHGGFGLIDDQAGETSLDLTWDDPNQDVADGAPTSGWTRSMYGLNGSHTSFDEGSCFDDALRRAGFFAESRLGALPEPTAGQLRRAEMAPAVVEAEQRRWACLEDAGFDHELSQDPEGSLRQRFLAHNLIISDGVHDRRAHPRQLRSAGKLEERVALADIRCRRQARSDQVFDDAIRSLIEGST